MFVRFLLFFLVTPCLISSQTTPELPFWNNAGYTSTDLPIKTIVLADLMSGSEPTADFINLVIQEYAPLDSQLVIQLPPGSYTLESPIVLTSNVSLVGSDTEFLFNLGGAALDGIQIHGAIIPATYEVLSSVEKGNQVLVIPNHSLLEGDLIYLSDNDNDLVYSSWAEGKTGQLFTVNAINQDSVFLNEIIRRDYELSSTIIQQVNPIKNVHISTLKLKRVDSTAAQTNNISLRYAQNCLISCLESRLCNFAHVRMEFCKNVSVRDSYFTEGHDYGGGGKAYGVVFQFASSDCLAENNIFEHLRHSVLLQAGPNGNVISYNHSTDPFWTDVMLPANTAGEYVLHGNFPYANLFEGNYGRNMVADSSHGYYGPDNTFYRNQIDEGFFFSLGNTPNLNIINNVFTGSAAYFNLSTTSYAQGNWQDGDILPEGTIPMEESSLYRTDAPPYFTSINFPSIDPANTSAISGNPASQRFYTGVYTYCAILSDIHNPNNSALDITTYPNPIMDHLNIQINLESTRHINISLIDLTGKNLNTLLNQEIHSGPFMLEKDLSHLKPGLYLLSIQSNHEKHSFKLIKN